MEAKKELFKHVYDENLVDFKTKAKEVISQKVFSKIEDIKTSILDSINTDDSGE